MSDDSLDSPLDSLAEEFARRYRRGERPSLTEFVERHPEFAEEIRELFPALVMMEKARSGDGPDRPPGALGEDAGCELHGGRIGDFRIIREVGRGGMGIVFEAIQESLGRHVALKILPASVEKNPRHLLRFQREARAAAKLHHTNIVPVFGVGESDGRHYYAMQFIQGLGLDEVADAVRRIRRNRTRSMSDDPRPKDASVEVLADALLSGNFPATEIQDAASGEFEPLRARPLAASSSIDASDSEIRLPGQSSTKSSADNGSAYWDSVARIGIQVSEALQYASNEGVLHRDVKPANLLLDLKGTVWVADFGLAKSDESDALTNPGDILGTLRYMAPERFQGQSDLRSDIYSLGATLYELLTLRPMFDESDRNRLIQRITQEEPTRPRSLDATIPLDLETIVLKAIARDPPDRYPSADAVAADLRHFLEDKPIRARRASHTERVWRWCRRNPVVAGLTGTLTLLLVVIASISTAAAIHMRQLARNEREATRNETTARIKAEQAGMEARREAARNRLLLYDADVQLAAQVWESDIGTAWAVVNLLEAHIPTAEEPDDLRDFAWHYQWALVNRNAVVIPTQARTVFAAVFAPDGHVLVLDSKRRLRRWNRATRQFMREFQFAGQRIVGAFSLSPDGRMIGLSPGDSVDLVDTATGDTIRTIKASETLRDVEFSGDCQTLVGLSMDNSLQFWNTSTGELRHTVSVGDCATYVAMAVSYVGDFVLLANQPANGLIASYNSRESHGRTLPGIRSSIKSVAVSPDGMLLAAGDFNGHVFLWDAATLQPSGAPLTCGTASVTRLEFSPDNRQLATGNFDAVVAVWDVTTRQRLHQLKGHTRAVTHLDFSADGKLLVSSADDGTVRLWDAALREPSRSLTKPGDADYPKQESLAFSPDGRWLASGGGGRVQVYEAHTGKRAHAFEGHPAMSVEFSPDSSILAAGGLDSRVKLWDVALDKEICTLEGVPMGPHDRHSAECLAFSPDGRMLAVGYGSRHWFDEDYDQILKIWDVASCREIRTLSGHRNSVTGVDFSPDGKWLATANLDRTVRLWDVATWKELRELAGPVGFMSVRFSPDGRSLAAASAGPDNKILIWETATGREVYSFVGHANHASVVAFSPDSRTLASAAWDNTTKLWDLRTGRETRTLRGHTAGVTCVAFSPDGHTLATTSRDFTIRMWDTLNAEEREQKAEEAFDTAVQRWPDDARVWLARSHYFARRDENLKAAADHAETLKLMPDEPALNSDCISYIGKGGEFQLSQGNHERAQPLLLQAINGGRRLLGPDHGLTQSYLRNLIDCLEKMGKYDEAEPLRRELVDFYKRTAPESPGYAFSLAFLAVNFLQQKKYADAEATLRECLTVRERSLPDDWTTYNTVSRLGEAIASQASVLSATDFPTANARFAEAEPLLIKGYEGLNQRQEGIPVESRTRYLAAAIRRLIELYEAWGKTDQAQAWQEKLATATHGGDSKP